VEALASLVTPDGNEPAIEGYAAKAKPLSAEQKKMIEVAARRLNEETAKKGMGVQHWVHDVSWEQPWNCWFPSPLSTSKVWWAVTPARRQNDSSGPRGSEAGLRLVPDMTAKESLELLKAHLAKKGFGDIEVNMTGGYDPTSTPADAKIVRAEETVYKRHEIDPVVLPRLAGSWPGYVFTSEPLKMPAAHFGLGHGSGAHAPDEYYVIESKNVAVQGIDGAAYSHVEYLYELAASA
jgi:hypothetical protein